ncbi:integral membrane sensor signal transduction histidine kinase [Denitrovibrio acetiphilus DSM 12809]|uniref:histidine kinase n=1 Tax=Denitrovibrio acetiphilus (strain DSM 12809 / NBRC 114555 / N2460) TaxID=522772 RepID=D4H517_DENA2|nr:HAMP domain-containing sensor histidine kinase [Denitrovibrio acetiphilus]ADD69373.1 integral membrane sensor signal transduction histidine kinase [Denitrovibrio acetiphilus DSM 12809]
MNWNLKLRNKIILAFIGYSILLSSLTILGVILATQISETRSYRNRAKIEAEYYLSDYISSFNAPSSNSFNSTKPPSPFITTYFGNELLPKWVPEKVPALKEGTYFVDHYQQKYCLLIRRLPDGENFYLLYNISRQGKYSASLHSLQRSILLTLLPIMILALILGLVTAHKVIGPILKLDSFIRNRPENERLPEYFDKNIHADEIGFLAKTLTKSINNMHDSIERENSFARDASHELRTPVTTMKNSLELLDELNPEMDKNVEKIIGRISRATSNMEHLIKSFLWLSRRKNLDDFDSVEVPIKELVHEVISEQSYILEKRDVVITVFDEGSENITAEPQLTKILIANLVRNAFTYTNSGYVKIHINKSCFQIHDSGRGIKPEVLKMMNKDLKAFPADGFGLGISIVKRLCNSLGWSFYIFSEEGKGTVARICYNTADDCANCAGFSLQSNRVARVENV